MTPHDAKRLVSRWYEEIWNQGRLDVADEIFVPDYVHPGQTVTGPESAKRVVQAYRTAFPDIHFTIDDMIEEGGRVATRLTMTGTHLGPLDGIPPTGRRVEIQAIGIFEVRGGKLMRHWGVFDALGMRRQLGMPA